MHNIYDLCSSVFVGMYPVLLSIFKYKKEVIMGFGE